MNSILLHNVPNFATKNLELFLNDILSAGLCSMDYVTALRLDCIGHNLNSYSSAIKEFLLLLKLGISQIFSSAPAFRYNRTESWRTEYYLGETPRLSNVGGGEKKSK